jgi:hypothetical protein
MDATGAITTSPAHNVLKSKGPATFGGAFSAVQPPQSLHNLLMREARNGSGQLYAGRAAVQHEGAETVNSGNFMRSMSYNKADSAPCAHDLTVLLVLPWIFL